MKKELVTLKQAKELKTLGFNEPTSHCYSKYLGCITTYPRNNRCSSFMPMPTVDEAIDWLRKTYDVMIYNTSAPFVDPKDAKNRIMYCYSVKYCNRRDGWNGRIFIGYAGGSYNIYAVKRKAISIAISWLKARNNAKKVQTRTARH